MIEYISDRVGLVFKYLNGHTILVDSPRRGAFSTLEKIKCGGCHFGPKRSYAGKLLGGSFKCILFFKSMRTRNQNQKNLQLMLQRPN